MKVYRSEEPGRTLLLRASQSAGGQAGNALLDAVVAFLTGKERRQ